MHEKIALQSPFLKPNPLRVGTILQNIGIDQRKRDHGRNTLKPLWNQPTTLYPGSLLTTYTDQTTAAMESLVPSINLPLHPR